MGNRKKVNTITFHAAYNYGSALQAYALQKRVCSLGFDYEIINLRTIAQRRLYPDPFKQAYTGIKPLLRAIYLLPKKRELDQKGPLFESFLQEELQLTRPYDSLQDLYEKSPQADFYITGSDQVWNLSCPDFDWAYFLPFCQGKKIAYAPSMRNIQSANDKKRVRKYLKGFSHISVREEESLSLLQELNIETESVVVDPTLLLTQEEWSELIDPTPIIATPYLFLYTPYVKENVVEIARALSNKLGLKIVISNLFDFKIIYQQQVTTHFASGPKEFLNLVRNATLICSSSFHALVFSILFERPFYLVDGDQDARMRQLLSSVGLQDRSISLETINKRWRSAYDIDFTLAKKIVEREREKSLQYLKKALEVE